MSPDGNKRSPVPLERDARGNRITKHGKGGYARGCGCDVCTAGWTASRRQQRGLLGPGGRLADEDKRTTHVSVRFSASENELIRQVLGGMPKAQYVRDAVLRQLSEDTGIPVGELDTARRAAPRSRNYSERQREEGQGE